MGGEPLVAPGVPALELWLRAGPRAADVRRHLAGHFPRHACPRICPCPAMPSACLPPQADIFLATAAPKHTAVAKPIRSVNESESTLV